MTPLREVGHAELSVKFDDGRVHLHVTADSGPQALSMAREVAMTLADELTIAAEVRGA